jgi:hypothetical protein
MARAEFRELCGENPPLTVGEVPDALQLADLVALEKSLGAPPTPPLLAQEDLSDRPAGCFLRAGKNDLGGGDVPAGDLSLQLRSGAPDVVRSLEREQPLRPGRRRCDLRHLVVRSRFSCLLNAILDDELASAGMPNDRSRRALWCLFAAGATPPPLFATPVLGVARLTAI